MSSYVKLKRSKKKTQKKTGIIEIYWIDKCLTLSL